MRRKKLCEKFGSWETDPDRGNKILLSEGAAYPAGYIADYRDKATFLLVMRQIRELTVDEYSKVKRVTASEKEIARMRRFVEDSKVNG